MTRPVAIAFTVLMMMIVVSGVATVSRVASATGAVVQTTGAFDERRGSSPENPDELLNRMRDVIDAATETLAARHGALQRRLDGFDSRLSEMTDRLDRMTEAAQGPSARIEEVAEHCATLLALQKDADRNAATRSDGVTEALSVLAATTKEHGTRLESIGSSLSNHVEEFAKATTKMMDNQMVGERVRQIEKKTKELDGLLTKHIEALRKGR